MDETRQEFCPHGARIVLRDGRVLMLLDECPSCAELIESHPEMQAAKRERVAA